MYILPLTGKRSGYLAGSHVRRDLETRPSQGDATVSFVPVVADFLARSTGPLLLPEVTAQQNLLDSANWAHLSDLLALRLIDFSPLRVGQWLEPIATAEKPPRITLC